MAIKKEIISPMSDVQKKCPVSDVIEQPVKVIIKETPKVVKKK